MAEIDYAAIFANQRVHNMGVNAVLLEMKHACALLRLQSEFGFVQAEKYPDDLVRVPCIRRWINMKVMDRSIRTAMRSVSRDLRDLILKTFCRKATRRHEQDLLSVFRGQQMPRQGGSACASVGSPDHPAAASAARRRPTKATISALAERRSQISASKASCSGRRAPSRHALDN
jgi:hypothetical protein